MSDEALNAYRLKKLTAIREAIRLEEEPTPDEQFATIEALISLAIVVFLASLKMPLVPGAVRPMAQRVMASLPDVVAESNSLIN